MKMVTMHRYLHRTRESQLDSAKFVCLHFRRLTMRAAGDSAEHLSDSDQVLCYDFHNMSMTSGTGTRPAVDAGSSIPSDGTVHVAVESRVKNSQYVEYLRPMAAYLMRTDVHTFAFSVAANVILSFFPFVVFLLTLSRKVFHSRGMVQVILQLLLSYLPAGGDVVVRHVTALADAHRGVKIFSLAMLLFSSMGVFVPLEVALNHAWGFAANRKYLANQAISLFLAVACGTLALISVALTAENQSWLPGLFGSRDSLLFRIPAFLVMKSLAIVATIAMFFLIYWLLPNGKVRAVSVLPGAILTGLAWDLSKYLYILALPVLDFQQVYGPFTLSVTLMFWAFLSGMLLLGGAQFSALRAQSALPTHI